MPNRNPRRGVHAPHTQGIRVVRLDEIEALGLLNAGAISILDYHLADDRFVEYMRGAVRDGLEVYCRVLTNGPFPDPQQHASRIVSLVRAHPYVKAWIPANEPNLEWSDVFTWQALDAWAKDLWFNCDYYRQLGAIDPAHFKLLYPPLAQDMGGLLDHRTGYTRLQQSIELFLDNADGIAWHSYWSAFDNVRLVEDEFPEWLRWCLSAPGALTLIHEAGRKIDDPNGSGADESQLGVETNHRFGAAHVGWAGTSLARAVTHWLLGSRDPAFQHQAWIDESGYRRQILYEVAWMGA